MKIMKISAVFILIAVSFVFSNLFTVQNCFAESESYRVCTDSCSIFKEPNSSLGSENILGTKSYGDIININPTEIADFNSNSNLKYFEVLDGENIAGYVLCSTVVKSSSSELKVNFQSNAKLNSNSQVYELFGESYNLMSYKQNTILLEKGAEIKILNAFDKNSKYTQIAFEYDNQILTGYVKTENVKISGFNYYLLIAIFLLLIIFTTVIPIVVKNWKKKKKLSNG